MPGRFTNVKGFETGSREEEGDEDKLVRVDFTRTDPVRIDVLHQK